MIVAYHQLIAEILIAITAVVGIAAAIVTTRRRRREKLRRRGIKKYGH
jgi:hypothetical protein